MIVLFFNELCLINYSVFFQGIIYGLILLKNYLE